MLPSSQADILREKPAFHSGGCRGCLPLKSTSVPRSVLATKKCTWLFVSWVWMSNLVNCREMKVDAGSEEKRLQVVVLFFFFLLLQLRRRTFFIHSALKCTCCLSQQKDCTEQLKKHTLCCSCGLLRAGVRGMGHVSAGSTLNTRFHFLWCHGHLVMEGCSQRYAISGGRMGPQSIIHWSAPSSWAGSSCWKSPMAPTSAESAAPSVPCLLPFASSSSVILGKEL